MIFWFSWWSTVLVAYEFGLSLEISALIRGWVHDNAEGKTVPILWLEESVGQIEIELKIVRVEMLSRGLEKLWIPFLTFDCLQHNLHGDRLESSKMKALVRAMRAEREMCLQDVATFKKLRDSLKARERKPWFMIN